MDFGIVEIISLLMGLQNFGVSADPKAPTPDAALQYAIPDADIVGHIDVASLVPGNYKILMSLPDQPQVKSSPELTKVVKKMLNEVEGPRGMAKGMIGLDPVNDINDATVFLQIVPHHDPSFVAIAHGKFGMLTIDKIAKLANKPKLQVGSAAWIDQGPDQPAIGLTKDGVLIAGTESLVKERMADTWKAPPHGAGTNLGYAADLIAQKPVLGLVLTMSQTSRTELVKNMPPQAAFFADVIKRHKAWSFGVYTDGIDWTWVDSKASGVEQMAQIADGMVDLLRAAQIAPRGLAKIILGGLESYKGTSKQVDGLLAKKADLLKLVNSFSGDGNFKVALNKDPKANKVDVRITGKTLSEVLPAGLFVPGMAAGWLLFGVRKSEAAMPPPMQMPAPMPAPAPHK